MKPSTFKMLHLPFLLSFSLLLFILSDHRISAAPPLIYGGCSQSRFTSGSPYESNLNSLFTSLLTSSPISNFNTFNISTYPQSVVFGLYQCQGDLTSSVCKDCVANSVSQLRTICGQAVGAVLQLEGCFVKYDNVSFFGVEDVGEVEKRCGPSVGGVDSGSESRRDAMLAYLTAGNLGGNGGYFRAGGVGSVKGVAQCVQDLSVGGCQECVVAASARLRAECETASWGDMFLGKCYVRYVDRQHHSRSDDEDVDKTLALTIGVITGVILLIIFLSSLGKICNKKGK